MQGIYRIRNKLNDKRYVGSTNDFERGLVDRLCALRKGRHHNIHLQRAWKKYGEENFVFEIQEEVEGNSRGLLACEQKYLDEGFELGILYNTARKAGGGNLGDEVNLKISEANKGHEVSQETRAKMSKAKLGKNNLMYGKRLTKETKAKISKAKTNPSKEVRARIGKASAKSYPAFYNGTAKKFISAGCNLLEICREHGLSYYSMTSIRNGTKKQTSDGWRLASLSDAPCSERDVIT